MTANPLLSGAFPAVADVAGHAVVTHYGDVAAEYHALRTGAAIADRSARGRVRVEGAGRTDLITGLVTNDVRVLVTGHGQYAVMLNPKGKIVADVRIFAFRDHLLIDTPPRASAGLLATLRKYINPRLAPFEDVSAAVRDIGLFGKDARRLVAQVTGLDPELLGEMPPYAHREAEVDGTRLDVVRVPDLELEGYDLLVPASAFEDVWQRFTAAGASPIGLLAWEIARIEAGRPEWGIDMNDTTIPQEANLDALHAISYTKGCYVGQEVVARVHFRGHVNRHLRGLLCGKAEPPATGAILLDDTGKQVGEVRSSALSPRLGAVALAMVRREAEPGATVTAQWSTDGVTTEIAADISRLPFPL